MEAGLTKEGRTAAEVATARASGPCFDRREGRRHGADMGAVLGADMGSGPDRSPRRGATPHEQPTSGAEL